MPSSLETRAAAEVQRLIKTLPPELHQEANVCAISYLSKPGPGEDPDLLGLFSGFSRGDPAPQHPDDMPRITLYLENLWEEAEGDETVFVEQVRITFLHEFGHYLGWDEDDLASRGLD